MTLIYKNAKGVRLRIDTNYDLTGYLEGTVIKMTKPDGTTTSLTPTITSLRYMDYTTLATTFASQGRYKFQAHLVTASKTLDGEIVELSISEPITVV